MIEDTELIRRFVRDRSETAFAELVQRHLDLVYSAALRRLGGDAHAAADVAQRAFIALAQQAESLSTDVIIPGWLYSTTRNLAVSFVRSERRRRTREQETSTMSAMSDPSPDAEWETLRPMLDEEMDKLSEADRAAVIMRYFQQRSFAEVGATLRVSEDAARMRVDRALQKLQTLLGSRGVTSTSGALAVVLANRAVALAPAGLAATVVATSTTSAVLGGASAVAAIFNLVKTGKFAAGIASALAIVGVGATIYWQTTGLSHSRSTDAATVSPAVHSSAATEAPQTKQSAIEPMLWDEAHLPALLAKLREQGAPPKILASVAMTVLSEHYAASRRSVTSPSGQPRWQSQSTRISPEDRKHLDDLRIEMNDRLRQLLGADYAAATMPDPVMLSTTMGKIAPEKWAGVNQIRSDYAATSSRTRAVAPGSIQKTEAYLEAEKNKELQNLLTPEEFEDYTMYQSDLAQKFQRRLRGLTLTDQQYEMLFRAEQEVRRSFRTAPETQGISDLSMTFRIKDFAALRPLLGDEAAAKVATNEDPGFQELSRIFTSGGNGASQLAEKYQEYLKFHAAVDQAQRGSQTQAETFQKGAPAAEIAHQALTTGLSETAREQFEATPLGKYLKRFTR